MLTEPARNNYYYGKLLDVGHLQLEQDYGKQKRWLLNRLTLGAGVLCGLTVSVVDDKLQVTGGVALDPLGREIVVPGTFTVDPFAPTPACHEPGLDPAATGVATLWLCYRECLTDYAAAAVSSCHGQERCEAGTIVESFSFHLSAGATDRPASDLCDRLAAAIKPGHQRAPVDPMRLLCELVPNDCPEPPTEDCVALATVVILEGQHLGDMAECAVRTRVYSQPVLLELITCLMTKVAECCDRPTDTLRIAAVDLVTGTAVGGSLTSPADPITIGFTAEPTGFRLTFDQAVDQGTVTVFADVPQGAASLLVLGPGGEGGQVAVPGRLSWESAEAVVWRIDDPGTMPPGTYDVTVFGDDDRNRPPVADPAGHRLDGEPLGLPSGEGSEGGDFTFKIIVTEVAPARLQVARVQVRAETGDDTTMQNPAEPLLTQTMFEPWGFQLWFIEDPNRETVTTYRAVASDRASLLVSRRFGDGNYDPVGGTLEWLSSNSVTWRIEEPSALPAGTYDVLINGDLDDTRQAVAHPNGQRLDGEPTALPSGDGSEGGSFTFTLEVTQSVGGPLRVEVVQILEANGDGAKLVDPAVPVRTSNAFGPSGFRVGFTSDVRRETVLTFSDVEVQQADLLVTRTNIDGREEAIPGSLTWESERVVVWRSKPFDPAADSTLGPGTYHVALLGDASREHPAITGADDRRLDGEPIGLPSGDGTEGGTFTFIIAVAEA
ncbi:MAG TPA: hypothetical protein VIM19_18385 [Actinomycetes bacterium]